MTSIQDYMDNNNISLDDNILVSNIGSSEVNSRLWQRTIPEKFSTLSPLIIDGYVNTEVNDHRANQISDHALTLEEHGLAYFVNRTVYEQSPELLTPWDLADSIQLDGMDRKLFRVDTSKENIEGMVEFMNSLVDGYLNGDDGRIYNLMGILNDYGKEICHIRTNYEDGSRIGYSISFDTGERDSGDSMKKINFELIQ